jgi:hypothetical protein
MLFSGGQTADGNAISTDLSSGPFVVSSEMKIQQHGFKATPKLLLGMSLIRLIF